MELRIRKSEAGFKEMDRIVLLNHLAHNPHLIWGYLLQEGDFVMPSVPDMEMEAIKQTILNTWEEYTS